MMAGLPERVVSWWAWCSGLKLLFGRFHAVRILMKLLPPLPVGSRWGPSLAAGVTILPILMVVDWR